MARRADGRLRPTTNGAAGAGEDVDAGWDDASTQVTIRPESAPITTAPPPASMSRKVGATHTPSPSLPPVSSVPRPKPSGRAPRALTVPPSWMDRATQLQERLGVSDRPSSSLRSFPAPAREEPTLVREEPTLEFGTEFLDESDIGAAEHATEESQVPVALPRVSEFDIPDFRRHQIGPAVIIAALGAAIALVVASVGSHQFPRQVPTELQRPATAAAPITPVSLAISAQAPVLQAPAAPSPDKSLNTVAVTVTVIPAAAVIFRAGQKLGAGTVQVSVDHRAKQRLTALHDGYAPYNFTLDGSRDTVTVRLKRAPRPQAAPEHTSDSPFEGPSEGPSERSTETPAE